MSTATEEFTITFTEESNEEACESVAASCDRVAMWRATFRPISDTVIGLTPCDCIPIQLLCNVHKEGYEADLAGAAERGKLPIFICHLCPGVSELISLRPIRGNK
jgi:hypothetical protein